MRTKRHNHPSQRLALAAAIALAACAGSVAQAQTSILSDTCTAANNASGFALNEGINSGINPPTATRLTGTVAENLRYIKTAGARADSNYVINNNRIRVTADSGIGRFTLSANGITPYNFASALSTAGASPADPAIYTLRIRMRNDATSTARFSFGIATAEGDVTTWDFGIQMYRPSGTDDYYTIQKRIDIGSSGTADINAVMTTTAPGTAGSLNAFLIRITDAGTETATFSSRVQVSLDDGATWAYDSTTDPDLPNGWRFDAPGRYIIFDQAANSSGHVFYDDFIVESIYAPPPPPERVWTGAGADDNWSTAANWGGTAPIGDEPLRFGLSSRQNNNNDIFGLTTPTLTFTNGGFVLGGGTLSIASAINNLAGSNTISLPLDWPNTGPKNWQIAPDTELHLTGFSTFAIGGDHILFGGGTLRLSGTLDINQNPALILTEGKLLIEGGTYSSLGGFRIGSSASASAPVQVTVANAGSITLEVPGANLRVGDGATAVPNRLIVNNGTVTLFGGELGIPYAAGCTGEVIQNGGLIKDCNVAFSDNGAGVGTYTLTNGTLEPLQIRKDTAAGTASILFQNAILRTALGANADFMSGLDLAEIGPGGLTLDITAPVTISQTLTGSGGLTKVSFETVTLAGTNTYAGNTLVQEGQLVLSTVQTNAGTVQVANSASLGVIRAFPGSSLTAGSLNLASATLNFDLGPFGNPGVPLINVATLSASAGPATVTVNINGGLGLIAGQFKLIDYSGAIGGSGFTAFTLGTLPPGVSATLVNNAAASSIDLNITAAPGFRWTGANGSAWDYMTVNWFNEATSSAGTYVDNQPVRFVDGAATNLVDLTSFFTPTAVIVTNNNLNYVFTGAGALLVPQLAKSGNGSLTRVDGTSDAINEILLNGGTYNHSNTFDMGFASVLTDTTPGMGTFAKSGPGVLTVSLDNSTFDGSIVIRDGILKADNGAALGSTNGTTTITNGGTLDLNDFNLSHEPVIVSGAGVNSQGAIIDSTASGAVKIALTDVTLAGDTTLGSPNGGRWDLRVRASTGPGPGLRGNGFNLTKVGSGFVSIACQRNLDADTPYWEMNLGNILITEGTLALAESLTVGNPGATITVNPGAILQLFDLGLTNPLTRVINLTDATILGGGNASHTNVLEGTIQLTGANTFELNNATLVVNSTISGSSSLGITGTGTAFLNGPNTYTGDTTLTNGTLGGTGTIPGNLVMLDGTLAPGWNGPGTLTVQGNATLAGTTRMALDRPNSSRLTVNGTLAFAGTLQVVLEAGANPPQAGDVYQLFNKGGSGAFASVTLPDLSALPGALSWNTNDLLTLGKISVEGALTPPSIQPPQIVDGNLVLTGSGGPAGGSYSIITSTNVATPLTDWVTNSVGTFTASGTSSNAIPVVPGEPQRFFLLKQP